MKSESKKVVLTDLENQEYRLYFESTKETCEFYDSIRVHAVNIYNGNSFVKISQDTQLNWQGFRDQHKGFEYFGQKYELQRES